MKAHGITDGSRIVAAIGTTAPMPGLLRSTATTPARTATATSVAVPLSYMPEGSHPCADCPAHMTKGPLSLDLQKRGSKECDTASRPAGVIPAQAGDGLFFRIADFESLYRGWTRARAGKRDQLKVAEFSASLESNLIQLQNELLWGLWQPGSYEAFEVHEPKKRMIYAPEFRDRVVHYAIHAVLSPIFDKKFYFHSYACRIARGTHRGAAYTQGRIRKVCRQNNGKAYALKADVSKYFQSIDHEVLKGLIRRRIKCPFVLELCDRIIDTSPNAKGVGIPLGNLTSQLFANIYLHELDHYVVNILRLPNYVRYMDDFVLVGADLKELKRAHAKIETFLRKELKLTLNKKTAIFPISETNGRSVDFLGYKIYPTHRRLRRRSVRKGYARAKDFRKDPNEYNLTRLTSWYAHARHAEPTGLMRVIFTILAVGTGNVEMITDAQVQ